ncbi:hypothetical protein [Streptosporangium sp. NPDC000396]|uniref:hypothetical protein n=1 Tax=Streptosporangium sp. NPDC000396 TaxID=3366185 RepID=UPI0036BA6AC4
MLRPSTPPRSAITFVYYSTADEHVRRLLTRGLHHADHIDSDIDRDDLGHAPASVCR